MLSQVPVSYTVCKDIEILTLVLLACCRKTNDTLKCISIEMAIKVYSQVYGDIQESNTKQ